MLMKARAQQRLQELIESHGMHLGKEVRTQLSALPAGWATTVRGMLMQVDQILDDDELGSFRWTDIRNRNGTLIASWMGIDRSNDIVEQIVEETTAEASSTCIDCGLPGFIGTQTTRGPHCCLHENHGTGLIEWEIVGADLLRSLHEIAARLQSSTSAAKIAAIALPRLVREAQAYFRAPDRDAPALLQQMRQALLRFDQEVCRSLGLSVAATAQ